MTTPRDASSVCTDVPFVHGAATCKGMRRCINVIVKAGFCYDRFWR